MGFQRKGYCALFIHTCTSRQWSGKSSKFSTPNPVKSLHPNRVVKKSGSGKRSNQIHLYYARSALLIYLKSLRVTAIKCSTPGKSLYALLSRLLFLHTNGPFGSYALCGSNIFVALPKKSRI